MTSLQIVRKEEGSVSSEEDRGTRGMESGRGNGKFGKMERLEEWVVSSVDLEQAETATRSGREEHLSSRVETNFDDRCLFSKGMVDQLVV